MSVPHSNLLGYGGLVSTNTGTFNQPAGAGINIPFSTKVTPNAVLRFKLKLIGNVIATGAGGKPVGSGFFQVCQGVVQNVGGDNVVAYEGTNVNINNGINAGYSLGASLNLLEFQVANYSTTESMQWRWFVTLYSQ